MSVISIEVKANWSSFKNVTKRSSVKSKEKRTKDGALRNTSMKI